MSAPGPRLGPILAAMQAGRTGEGIAALDRFIDEHPGHVEALALAGFFWMQHGETSKALEFLDRAVEADPRHWLARLNRAGARRLIDDHAGAADDYLTAARENPQPEFWIEGAAMLEAAAKKAEARRALDAALALAPEHPVALNNLGLLIEAEEPKAALALFLRAAAADPGNADIEGNLERALVAEGLGIDRAEPEGKGTFWREALRLHPEMGGLWTGFGNHLLGRGDFVEAEAAFVRALELMPERAEAAINLGIAHHRQGRPEEAFRFYARAEALEGGSPSSALRWNRALSRLAFGDLEDGFADYEARDYLDVYRRLPLPRWKGEGNGTLLLHTEQGFGDAIQFARYAALAKERGVTVLLACDAPLKRLLACVRGVDEIVPASEITEAAKRCDWEAPLLSLPHIFGTRLETIPAAVPYLILEGERKPAEKLLRVGLVASGNPKYGNDLRRSLPAGVLAPLGEIPGVAWTGFHYGGNRPAGLGPWLADGMEGAADFYDTALRLREMDLVVSVDTATAHLAGALGLPVWILLPEAADWRWLRGRTDSPWYPTARLFRQPRDGAWADVVAAVREALLAKI